METITDNHTSSSSVPRSRASRNEQLYKDINKMELQNYEVKSNATVLGDNRRSIDVDKIKSILDTHYNDAPKRRTIAIEEPEKETPNPIFETKEYDINVVINKAKDQKHDDIKEDQNSKLHDTEFNILKNLDLDEEEPEDRAINPEKSKELETLINTISINEKEIEKAKHQEEEVKTVKEETDYLDTGSDDTEEDLFASLLGGDDTQVIEGSSSELDKEIDKLKTEGIDIVNNLEESKEEEPPKEEPKEKKKDKDKEKVKEIENKQEDIDRSFFTKSNAIKKKDFEEFEDLADDEESSNTFVKIFIVILLIIFIAGIIILIKSFI